MNDQLTSLPFLLNDLQNLTKKIIKVNPCPAEPPICPAFENSIDPDQLASEEEKPTNLDLHCLSFSMSIYINNLD